MAEAEPQAGNVNLLKLSVQLAELQERRKATESFAQAIVDEASGNEEGAKRAQDAVEEADSKADFLRSEGDRFLRSLEKRNITLPLDALRALVVPNSSQIDGAVPIQEARVLPAPQIEEPASVLETSIAAPVADTVEPAATAEKEAQLPKILIDLKNRIATNPDRQPPTFIKAQRGSFLWDLLIMLSYSDMKTGIGKVDIDALLLSHHLKPLALPTSISKIRSKLEINPRKPVLIKTIRSGDEYDTHRYFRRFAVEEVDNLWSSWDNARKPADPNVVSGNGHIPEEVRAALREVPEGGRVADLVGTATKAPVLDRVAIAGDVAGTNISGNGVHHGPSRDELAALERAGIEVEEDLLPSPVHLTPRPTFPNPISRIGAQAPIPLSGDGFSVTREDITREARMSAAAERNREEVLDRARLGVARNILVVLNGNKSLRSFGVDPVSLVKGALRGTSLEREFWPNLSTVRSEDRAAAREFAVGFLDEACRWILNNPDNIPNTAGNGLLKRAVESLKSSGFSPADISAVIRSRWQ